MIRVWRDFRGQAAIQLDSGMGSPAWNHWAILVYRPNGEHVRLELADSEQKLSNCGKWKLQSSFRQIEGKLKK